MLALHKRKTSLRQIVAETGLGFRTVRTIVEKAKGTDRTSRKRKELKRIEFNRLRAADYRARKRQIDMIPERLAKLHEQAAALVKAAKGLGKR